jgi:hypothetical protein
MFYFAPGATPGPWALTHALLRDSSGHNTTYDASQLNGTYFTVIYDSKLNAIELEPQGIYW